MRYFCDIIGKMSIIFSSPSAESAADAVDVIRAMQAIDAQDLTQFEAWLEAIMAPTESPISHE